MAEPALLTAALLLVVCGMACLAVAMKVHWLQVQASKPHSEHAARQLRVAGGASSFSSLAACLLADHPSMALLVWIMR